MFHNARNSINTSITGDTITSAWTFVCVDTGPSIILSVPGVQTLEPLVWPPGPAQTSLQKNENLLKK